MPSTLTVIGSAPRAENVSLNMRPAGTRISSQLESRAARHRRVARDPLYAVERADRRPTMPWRPSPRTVAERAVHRLNAEAAEPNANGTRGGASGGQRRCRGCHHEREELISSTSSKQRDRCQMLLFGRRPFHAAAGLRADGRPHSHQALMERAGRRLIVELMNR
jgi:hypothetical protein